MAKIAINGFGRIGRAFFKLAITRPELEIVAINDLGDLDNLAYLLKYDSAYGRYDKEISTKEADGKKYLVLDLYETQPKRLWKRIAVEPGNLLPKYWIDYQDGQLWTYSLWRNIQLNAGIADSVFKL